MRLACPNCRRPFEPDEVNVGEGVVYCRECHEAFQLSALVEHLDSPRIKRPADAKCTLIAEQDRLALVVPAGGLRGAGCFLLFFSAFWNVVTWIFVVGALWSQFQGLWDGDSAAVSGVEAETAVEAPNVEAPGPKKPSAKQPAADSSRSTSVTSAPKTGRARSWPQEPWIFLFLLPFVIIGLVTALLALFCLFGKTELAMDKEEGVFLRRLFGFHRRRAFRVEEIQAVKIHESYRQNERPVYGVGILFGPRSSASFTKRPIVFGTALSEDEKAWLAGEINAFWRRVAPRRK